MTNSAKADLLLVGVTLLAAISWILSREAVLLMPPLLFMSLRFLLAATLLATLGHAPLRRLDASALRRSATAGLVFAAGMSTWIIGLALGTHVGEGAFLTSLGVVLAPVLGWLCFGEKPARSMWFALPIAIAGLALLALQHGFRPEPSQLFYLGSAVLFALFFHLNTHAATERTRTHRDGRITVLPAVPAIALTSVVLGMVGAVSGVLALILEPWRVTLGHFTPAMAGWVIASATLGTALRFLIQTHAQSLSPHTHGVVILVLEPVWVALLAAVWLGETMSGQQLAGCALILGALLINRATLVRDWVRAGFR